MKYLLLCALAVLGMALFGTAPAAAVAYSTEVATLSDVTLTAAKAKKKKVAKKSKTKKTKTAKK
jgi:hypothetical protein